MLSELNPLEACEKIVVPRNDKKRMTISHVNVIHGSLVYAGSDIDFNKLRILPPAEFHYPDILKDGSNFYKLIGLPKLRFKYMKFKK